VTRGTERAGLEDEKKTIPNEPSKEAGPALIHFKERQAGSLATWHSQASS